MEVKMEMFSPKSFIRFDDVAVHGIEARELYSWLGIKVKFKKWTEILFEKYIGAECGWDYEKNGSSYIFSTDFATIVTAKSKSKNKSEILQEIYEMKQKPLMYWNSVLNKELEKMQLLNKELEKMQLLNKELLRVNKEFELQIKIIDLQTSLNSAVLELEQLKENR